MSKKLTNKFIIRIKLIIRNKYSYIHFFFFSILPKIQLYIMNKQKRQSHHIEKYYCLFG